MIRSIRNHMGDADPVRRQPQTLAQVWHETSLMAPGWTVRHSILTGVVAIAGIVFDQGRWSYSLLYLIVGCFGARALALGPGRARARIRVVLDLVAACAMAAVVLQALKFLFGGTVGLIRA